MALWWVTENQVVGPVQPGGCPANFVEVEGVEATDRDLVYFDGEAVVLRPPKPSPDAAWDVEANEWWIPAPLLPLTEPNWSGLVNALRGSPIWAKAYTAGDRTLKAQNAFTLMMGTLTGTQNLADLVFAVERLRDAMRGIATIGDFTDEELETISGWLTDSNFDASLFNLEPYSE